MKRLIHEISTIVSQYGQDIVTEERFVNILKDLYPDRDHPEKFDILKAIVEEGISSEMIATVNANNAKLNVEKHAKVLSAKSGYNQQDISQVLYCLCIGCDCISIDDYNALKKQSKPKPTPSKPKGKPKPAPSPSKPNKPSIKSSIRFKDLLGLTIAICGIVSIPFMCFALLENGWWPFFVLIFLGVFQFAIILVIGFMIYGSDINSSNSTAPEIEAGFSAVCFCASVFYISLPFILINKPNVDSGSPLSFFLEVILCGANGFIGYMFVSDSLDSFVHQTDIKRVIKAFSLTLLAVILLFGLFYFFPYIKNTLKSNMDLKRYEEEVKQVESIRRTRETKSIELSFMDFNLGDSINHCFALLQGNSIHSIQRGHYLNEDLKHKKLIVNNLDYSVFIDTVLYADSEWDNERINLHLFFHDQRLMAIEMINRHELDSLLEIYSRKYGEPECVPQRLYEYQSEYDIVNYGNADHKEYLWTFLNGIIQLTNDYDDSFSLSVWHVRYIDRQFESILKRKHAEEERRRLDNQKRDSIRKLEIEAEKEKMRIKEEIKKNENHRNAMDQI